MCAGIILVKLRCQNFRTVWRLLTQGRERGLEIVGRKVVVRRQGVEFQGEFLQGQAGEAEAVEAVEAVLQGREAEEARVP